jgi:hypothetical protein
VITYSAQLLALQRVGEPPQTYLFQFMRWVVRNNWPGGADQQIHVAKELLKQVISPGVDTGTLVSYGEEVLFGSENERDHENSLQKEAPTGLTPRDFVMQ